MRCYNRACRKTKGERKMDKKTKEMKGKIKIISRKIDEIYAQNESV